MDSGDSVTGAGRSIFIGSQAVGSPLREDLRLRIDRRIELALLHEKLGIDAVEVIKACATK